MLSLRVPSPCHRALAAALLCASAPVAAQESASSIQIAPVIEAGAFAYGRDRYPDDTEVRFAAAGGVRVVASRFFFIEPHLRVLVGLDGWGGGDGTCGDDLACLDGSARAIDRLPTVWPGVTIGTIVGDQSFSHAFAARAALAVVEQLHPLLALRYEASARRAGWFAEASVERFRWSTPPIDEFGATGVESRWSPGIQVGARWWMRSVSVPAPKAPGDAGIIGPAPVPRKP